jgi:hypothetical protein
VSSTIRIEAQNRWQALALMQRLADQRSFLIKHNGYFDVCVPATADATALPDILARVEAWLQERSVPATTVRLPDGSAKQVLAAR